MNNKYIICNNLNFKTYRLDYLLLNLLKSQIHIGNIQKRFNNELTFYIYGLRGFKYIFNLKWIILLLNRALNFIYQIIIRKGSILFINTLNSNSISKLIQNFSKTYGYQLIDYKWIGGLLTNSNIISLRPKLVKENKIKVKKVYNFNSFNININYYSNFMKDTYLFPFQYIKNFSYKIGSIGNFNYIVFGNKLIRYFDNNFHTYNLIASKFVERVVYNNINVKYIDSIILFTDSVDKHDIISEILSLNVPIISICNTDLHINSVNYLILGNSSSIYSISIYLNLIKQIIEKGELFLKFEK